MTTTPGGRRSRRPAPQNTPLVELERSPAAARVGALAGASGLFLSHFEHRIHLPLPAHWLPEDRPDLGAPAGWRDGVLRESKYQHFRLDQLIGSFHPHHTAAWTAHALCHALVGFAWRPGAPRLFHALAARLGEVLPTALWYFFDEAFLRRCPAHAGQGPLFGTTCAACEAAALAGALSEDPGAERMHADGLRFVERELAAIARSRRTGRCEPNAFASLDLASDGLAYVAAHAERLNSEEMEEWVSLFFAPETGHFDTLDAMEARVLEVRDHLLGRVEARPWTFEPSVLAARDLGFRLLCVRAETEGEAADELTAQIRSLATGATAADVFARYEALFEEHYVPEPRAVFAVGYDLPGVPGRSVQQVTEGLVSVCPGTCELLAEDLEAAVRGFVASDVAVRRPLARRFAAFLARGVPGPIADLARYEAAIAHPAPADAEAMALGAEPGANDELRRVPGFEVLHFDCDVVALARALDAEVDEPVTVGESRTCLVIGRPRPDELTIVDVKAEVGRALEAWGEAAVPVVESGIQPDELEALRQAGVLVPGAWRSE